MLALLVSEAAHRGLPPTVMTLRAEPARLLRRPRRQARGGAGAHRAAARQARRARALRHRAGGGPALRRRLRGAVARGLHRPGAGRRPRRRATCWSATTSASAPGAPATTPCSTPPAPSRGFDVARMMSYEVHGLRVSSSAVRAALAAGDMKQAEALLGRPYSISGHVIHGAKLGRGARRERRRPRRRLPHPEPALPASAAGGDGHLRRPRPRPGRGAARRRRQPRPAADRSTTAAGSCSKCTVFDWPQGLGSEGGYGKLVRVELLAKLRDEARYDSLEALAVAIRGDAEAAQRLARRRGQAARRHRPPDDARSNLTRPSTPARASTGAGPSRRSPAPRDA